MIELHSMSLRGLAYYKSATLDFTPGITAILGANKNARTAGASNGSGKSSLFIPLHAALGYSAPLIRGRQGAKDIFDSASEASLTFKRGKSTYSSVRKGSKFVVSRDGKDLGLRTQSLALEKLETLRGLTEIQFYSTVYLDSSRPHTFQSGTSSDRLNFFTELFDLHDVDTVRSYCRSLMTEAADAEREAQRIEAELAALTVSDTTEAETELNTLVAKQDSYQRKSRRFVAVKHMIDMLERDAQLAEKIAEAEKLVDSDTEKDLKAKLKAVNSYASAVAKFEGWDDQRKVLLETARKLQKVVGNLSLREAKSELGRLDALAQIEKPEKPTERRRDEKPDYGSQKEIEAAKERLSGLRATYSEQKETLNSLEDHGVDEHSGSCPLCKSKLKPNHFTTLLSTLKAGVEETKNKITKLQHAINVSAIALHWADYDSQLAGYNKQVKDFDEEKHAALRRYVKTLTSYASHKENKPQVPKLEVEDSAEELQARLDAVNKLKTLMEQPRAPEDSEAEVRSFAKTNGLTYDYALLRTYIGDHEEKLVTKLRELNNRIPKLKSQIDMAKADAKRARKLQAEIQTKKQEATDLPVLKMLVEAYSKSGIKSLLVNRLAKAIETNMNRLVSTVFREPMKFELVVEGQNFHVLAHRKNMGKPRVSDVRLLSGAERRMFILLFLLATLPLLPAAKRYDTLILDEPFANLDAPNIEMLRDRLMPKLLKVVPKVVVILTHSEHVPQGARVFTAVKHNAETKLEAGHVK